MILLDSSILIDLFRKRNKLNTFFFQLLAENDDFAISSITHYEIGVGNKKSHWSYWEDLYSTLIILPFDRSCSETASEIFLDLRKRNKVIDFADLLIGSTALAHSIPLATLNKKHFERISDLKLIGREQT